MTDGVIRAAQVVGDGGGPLLKVTQTALEYRP